MSPAGTRGTPEWGLSAFPRSFFDRHPATVAPDLLNCLLACGDRIGRIVEVEAYGSDDDAASHAYRGCTPRNRTMFGPTGHLYVYFVYGMHFCANVVCGEEGSAGAVLLRALRPVAGKSSMRERRPNVRADSELCRGPANLCRAMGIDRIHDGIDLLSSDSAVHLGRDGDGPPNEMSAGVRVGLSLRAGSAQLLQWRSALKGDECVSRPRLSTV